MQVCLPVVPLGSKQCMSLSLLCHEDCSCHPLISPAVLLSIQIIRDTDSTSLVVHAMLQRNTKYKLNMDDCHKKKTQNAYSRKSTSLVSNFRRAICFCFVFL